MHGKGQNDFADTISRYFPDLIAILIFFQCISHSTRFSSIRRFDLGSIREKQLKAKNAAHRLEVDAVKFKICFEI